MATFKIIKGAVSYPWYDINLVVSYYFVINIV